MNNNLSVTSVPQGTSHSYQQCVVRIQVPGYLKQLLSLSDVRKEHRIQIMFVTKPRGVD